MSIAALFTIAKIWKQHKCPSTDEWRKKMIYIHTHNGILLSHKKDGILPFATTWMDLEVIMLSEMSDKDKYSMLYVESKKQNKQMYVTKQKQTHR